MMTSGSLPSPNPKPRVAVCYEPVTPGMTPTGGKQNPWAQEGETSALTHPTDKLQQRLFSHFISMQHGNRMPIRQRKHTGLRNWYSREAHSRWRAGHRRALQRHATSPLPSLGCRASCLQHRQGHQTSCPQELPSRHPGICRQQKTGKRPAKDTHFPGWY